MLFPVPRNLVFGFLLAAVWLAGLSNPVRAQTETAATTPAPVFVADIERLSDTEVAAAIQLTVEQRGRVLQILSGKQAAIAAAETDEAKAAAKSAAETELQQVLSEEQRRLFDTLFSGKTLKFNFRSQKWPDVLAWLAGEADLSLIMNSAPSGVFTFADSREYTPAQAIDLVNGWLLTQGFTLVRRERTLLCLSLSGGFPEGAIPRILPAELPVRGRFDFVSVIFSLNDRPGEPVLEEVTPLLGKYGNVKLLPQTKQLLATDTVLNLRSIKAVLDEVPEQSPENMKSRLAVYPVQHSSPERAGEVLRELIDGTVVVDAEAGQVSVYASTDDQAVAKIVLEQLNTEPGGDARPVLEVYPAVVPDPLEFVATLQLLAPRGQYRVDPTAGKLIAWASPVDQEKIRLSLEQLLQGQSAGGPRVVVYQTGKIPAVTVSTILAGLVPTAQVTVNSAGSGLVVLAMDRDHQKVSDLLQQLQESEETGDQQRELRGYPITAAFSTTATSLLATVLPTVQVIPDTDGSRLLILARPTEHAQVGLLLQSIVSAERTERTLKSYSLEELNQTTATTMLAAQIPTAAATVDALNVRLLVMATAADHQRVEALLTELRVPGSKKSLQFYALGSTPGTTAVSTLSLLVPQAVVTLDAPLKRLSVIATAEDHAKIEQTLQTLQEAAGDTETTLQFYAVEAKTAAQVQALLAATWADVTFQLTAEGNRLMAQVTTLRDQEIRALLERLQTEQPFQTDRSLQLYSIRDLGSNATTVLQSAVPGASISSGAEANQLMIVGTESEHQQIKVVLQTLQEAAGDTEKTLQFYAVEAKSAAQIQALLVETWADVTFQLTAEGTRLMAQVTTERDQEIRALLARLQTEQPFQTDRSLQLYSIRDLGGNTTTVLQAAVPAASITSGAHADQLMVVATAAEHEQIAELLKQLGEARPSNPEKVLSVYPLRGSSAAAVIGVLTPLVEGDVQLTADPGGRQLFVRAPEFKQQEIAKLIETVTAGIADQGDRETRSYVIGAPNADEVQEVLLALFPDATIVTDADRKMIVATATAVQHETIEQVASQMRGTSTGAIRPVPKIYSLKNVDTDTVENLIESMYSRYDGVRVTVSDSNGSLIVLAREDQHVTIGELIEQLDIPGESAEPNELAVFRLNRMDALSVQEALGPVLPAGAKITPDRIGRQLFVSAPTSKMPEIRQMVADLLASNGAPDGELKTESYWLRPYEADEAQEVLERLIPDAVLVTDTADEVLVATATPEQHRTIQQVVEQMMSRDNREDTPVPRSYRLRSADGQTISLAMQTMFSRVDNVQVSFDAGSNALLVVARPKQHEMIAGLVRELEPPISAETARTIEVYSLPGIDGDTVTEVIQGALRAVDEGASISWESSTQQLVVSATAAGQAEARVVAERFQESDDRETAVIQLTVLTADAAVNAIEGLFGTPSDSSSRSSSSRYSYSRSRYAGPVVQADEDLEQLLIRGTPKQIEEIRDLLTQMGEPSAGGTSGAVGRSNSSMRVIPIPGDVDGTIRKIQNLWPSLRGNRIRVLRPGDLKPQNEETQQQGSGDDTSNIEEALRGAKVSGGSFAPAASAIPVSLATPTVDESDQDLAEVVLIPGSGRVTIVSDDPAALDQLERILRSLSAAGGIRRNRDFAVYQLQNAGAEDVADTIEDVYKSPAGSLAFGSVVIVPETRLNVLIVYGNRSDRDRIEQLLEVLDTEKIPDSGRVFRTEVITVRHASAERIEAVLQGVYSTELAAGGARRPVSIPAGIDAEVASVLRQLNARNSAPLLTIEVQQETNSLVVKAPQTLIEELQELVARLDESARSTRAEGIRMIPLQKVNSQRVMEILGDVLNR